MITKLSQTEWNQFAAESHYNTCKLAQLLRLSPRQLERIIRRDLGSNPRSWLNQRRLVEARMLLLAGQRVKAVAADLGYKQPSHFCREFKRHFGTTPRDYFMKMSRLDNNVAFRTSIPVER